MNFEVLFVENITSQILGMGYVLILKWSEYNFYRLKNVLLLWALILIVHTNCFYIYKYICEILGMQYTTTI